MYGGVEVTKWRAGDAVEPIGTKQNCWLREEGGASWLFKEARSEPARPSGQDWAEKAVAEFAKLLGVPAATVELAHRSGKRGVISRNFVRGGDELTHGNELLSGKDPDYPQDQQTNDTPGYHVGAIRDVLRPYVGRSSDGLTSSSAFDGFVGYLVLDAWVNNTDRHHRNWGVIRGLTKMLAPSFDHASSLEIGRAHV